MRISAIVPTRNSDRTLAACLESLRNQTHPDTEIRLLRDPTHTAGMVVLTSVEEAGLFKGMRTARKAGLVSPAR